MKLDAFVGAAVGGNNHKQKEEETMAGETGKSTPQDLEALHQKADAK